MTESLTPTAPQPQSQPQPAPQTTATTAARWIWTSPQDPAPVNRFTWFRKVVPLSRIPEDATLLFAADSTARLLINGQVVRRKVTRYHEPQITAEVVNAGPYLHTGDNVITVLHHNWGDIRTFQRTGNKHAGLFLSAGWISTDDSWEWTTASEFLQHNDQIVGIAGGAHRIRFPVIMDNRNPTDFAPDAPVWKKATAVDNGPWPKTPPDPVETPGQREHFVAPYSVLAAGRLETTGSRTTDVYGIAEAMHGAKCLPDASMTSDARQLTAGRSLTLRGRAGESLYVTFDFARPVHGYPSLQLEGATSGTVIDWGYCEIPESMSTGEAHVRPDGWIDPTGVVGKGYADRLICRSGPQQVEIPEERTGRWMTLHVHFPEDGELVLSRAGMIKSQFPVNPVGSFECGDPVMDQIVRLALIHAEVTMSDAYVDTPGREDGQWIEDAQLRALISERWFADTTLRRLLLRTYAQGIAPDGQSHPFPPSNFPASASYDWSVQWVATLWDEYQWSGDRELVRHYWPVLTRYWTNVLSKVNEEGLWQTPHVLADIFVGVRPGHPRHSSGIVTPMMIERLGWSIALADALGESKQAAEWRAAQERMKNAFRRFHVVPTSGTIPLHVGDLFDPEHPDAERGYSQAGQLIAAFSSLLSPEEGRQDLEYSFPAPDGTPPPGISRWNNPTMSYRALKALNHVGLPGRAVAHLRERFSQYLPANPANPVDPRLQGPFGGPLPEYWISRTDLGTAPGEKNPAQPGDPTGSHGWASVPLYWLHEELLGVTIAEPGGGRLRIAPQTGGLPYVAGWTNTPHGPAYVYYDPQQWRVEVILPAGAAAGVVFPPEWEGKRVKAGKEREKASAVSGRSAEISGPGRFAFSCY